MNEYFGQNILLNAFKKKFWKNLENKNIICYIINIKKNVLTFFVYFNLFLKICLKIYFLLYGLDILHVCSITHNVLVLQYKKCWISYEKLFKSAFVKVSTVM